MHNRPGQNTRHTLRDRWETIYPGAVLWVDQMQTLASARQLEETGQTVKRRPVVALRKTVVKVDTANICLDNAFMLAINSTSQEHLVEGRPGIYTKINQNDEKTSHFWFDTLNSVPLKGTRIDIRYSMNTDERKELAQGLDQVLQPEKRFFLKTLFNAKRGCLPGQVWTIDLPNPAPTGPATIESDALVLLRRGAFYVNDDEQDRPHFTPYLVAVLPEPFNAGNMRGLSWNALRLTAIHERSFKYQIGHLTAETVGIMLNTLRREVSLAPIQYQQPMVTHLFQWLNPLNLLSIPRLRGF